MIKQIMDFKVLSNKRKKLGPARINLPLWPLPFAFAVLVPARRLWHKLQLQIRSLPLRTLPELFAFTFKERFRGQFRVEVFKVLNHPNFANPVGGPSGGSGANDPSVGAGYGCGCVTMDEGGQNPVLGSGGPRDIQLGLKLLW